MDSLGVKAELFDRNGVSDFRVEEIASEVDDWNTDFSFWEVLVAFEGMLVNRVLLVNEKGRQIQ